MTFKGNQLVQQAKSQPTDAAISSGDALPLQVAELTIV